MKFFVRNEWEQKVLQGLYGAPKLLLPLNEVVICYDSTEKKYENIVDGDEYHNVFDVIKTDFNITDVDSLTRVHVLTVLSEMKLEYIEKDDSIIVGDGTETYHVNKFLDTFDINFYIKRNFVLGSFEGRAMYSYYNKLFNPIYPFENGVNYKYNFDKFIFEKTDETQSHLKDILSNFNVRNMKGLDNLDFYIRIYPVSNQNESDMYLDYGIDLSGLYRIDAYPVIRKSSDSYYTDDSGKEYTDVYNAIGFSILPKKPKSCGLLIDGVIHNYNNNTKLLYNSITRNEVEINIDDYKDNILMKLPNHSNFNYNYVKGKYTDSYYFNSVGKRKGLEHYTVDYESFSEYECIKLRTDMRYVKDDVVYYKVYENVYLNPITNTFVKSEEEFEKFNLCDYDGLIINLENNMLELVVKGRLYNIDSVELSNKSDGLYVTLANKKVYSNIDDFLEYSKQYGIVEPTRVLNGLITKILNYHNKTLSYNYVKETILSNEIILLLENQGILSVDESPYSVTFNLTIFNLKKSITLELYQTESVTNRLIKVCHI